MSFFSKIIKWIPLGRVNEVTSLALTEKLGSGDVQIIDVRTTAEWKLSAIEGSINLPITSFNKSTIDALNLDKKKLTVAICLSAHRSIPAVRVLKEFGFDNTAQLKGGMKSWWSLKLPTQKSEKN